MIQDPAVAHAVHLVFEAGGLSAGAACFALLRRRGGHGSAVSPANFPVLAGCLLGAAIGNKLVFWLQVPHLFAEQAGSLWAWLGGQSIVGGLVGGLLGVEAGKRLAGLRESTGDHFVFPILLGLVIGRIGCFLAGRYDDTSGTPTTLPWGVDFGDGIPRHPTQVYEMLFALLAAAALARARGRLAAEPGLLFKILLTSYLCWRFVVDFIKPVPFAYPGGLSGIQVVCLAALLLYVPVVRRAWRRGVQ